MEETFLTLKYLILWIPLLYVIVSGYSKYWTKPGLGYFAWSTSDQHQNKEGSRGANGSKGQDLWTGKWIKVQLRKWLSWLTAFLCVFVFWTCWTQRHGVNIFFYFLSIKVIQIKVCMCTNRFHFWNYITLFSITFISSFFLIFVSSKFIGQERDVCGSASDRRSCAHAPWWLSVQLAVGTVSWTMVAKLSTWRDSAEFGVDSGCLRDNDPAVHSLELQGEYFFLPCAKAGRIVSFTASLIDRRAWRNAETEMFEKWLAAAEIKLWSCSKTTECVVMEFTKL